MGKKWHYAFLVAAFLIALFPPMYSAAPGMHMTTKFVFVFSQLDPIGPNANWPVLVGLEASLLTAFAVIAADHRADR